VTAPAIWIDACSSDPKRTLFGMTLLEHLLRSVVTAGLEPPSVEVALSESGPIPEVRADLLERLPVRFERGSEPVGARVRRANAASGARPLLVLAASDVVDPRILAHLAGAPVDLVFFEPDAPSRGAAFRLPADAEGPEDSETSVRAVAEASLGRGDLKAFDPADFDPYVRKLRRELAPYLFRVDDDASVARVERFLFWSNYKGSTDFMTRYVYPPLVWAMVRPLARRRVHPNWITGINWLACFGAIPFFAEAQWVPGLALAYWMSVLDSVDGKLARLTHTTSTIGDLADHGLDIIHPPFWYLAWGYALGGGTTAALPFQAALVNLGLYAADRIVTAIFRQRTGTSIHGVTPLDVRMRTVISRRNVNLALFTLALAVDAVAGTHVWALGAFYFTIVWQGLSLLWHTQRLWAFFGVRLRD